MKYIIAMLLSLSLTGCMYQTVNQYDINRAIKVCGSASNISEIVAHSIGEEKVHCFSGESLLLGEVKGDKR